MLNKMQEPTQETPKASAVDSVETEPAQQEIPEVEEQREESSGASNPETIARGS